MGVFFTMSYEANRTLKIISAIWAWADGRDEVTGSNPCRRLEKYPEQPRERYLTDEELARLGDARQDRPLCGCGNQDPDQARSEAKKLLGLVETWFSCFLRMRAASSLDGIPRLVCSRRWHLSTGSERLGARFRKHASVVEYGLLVNEPAHRNGYSRLAEF